MSSGLDAKRRTIILAFDLFQQLAKAAADRGLSVQPFVHLVLQNYLTNRRKDVIAYVE